MATTRSGITAFGMLLWLVCSWLVVAGKAEVPPTRKPIKLFNGKNLRGFDTFLKTKGLNHDPDNVFQVHDGMIRISGAEYGYLLTQKEYRDYYLRAEFKWGEATYAPREGKARDTGILFHCVGPNKIWPRSIEFQIIEGGTGDVILVDGASLAVNGETKNKGRFPRYGKGSWQDATGYRDPQGEVEKPHGEWNVLELIADGDKVEFLVNGRLVNEGSGANPSGGRILLESEGAEVFFRNLELRPLKKKRQPQ